MQYELREKILSQLSGLNKTLSKLQNEKSYDFTDKITKIAFDGIKDIINKKENQIREIIKNEFENGNYDLLSITAQHKKKLLSEYYNFLQTVKWNETAKVAPELAEFLKGQEIKSKFAQLPVSSYESTIIEQLASEQFTELEQNLKAEFN